MGRHAAFRHRQSTVNAGVTIIEKLAEDLRIIPKYGAFCPRRKFGVAVGGIHQRAQQAWV
jgi:hypothetical protein